MFQKKDLIGSMVHDCNVAKHLYTKLGPGALEYRPSENQRSSLELLQYLSVCGIGGATCMAKGSWDHFKPFSERSTQMKAEDFPSAMDLQVRELKELFDGLSEEDLQTQDAPLPGGGTMKLGAAILHAPAKWLSSYKMQLFLYAKAAGATEIGTVNAWAGMDPQK